MHAKYFHGDMAFQTKVVFLGLPVYNSVDQCKFNEDFAELYRFEKAALIEPQDSRDFIPLRDAAREGARINTSSP